MPCDGRIGGIRQADFLKPGAALECRHIVAFDRGQESLAQHAVDVVAVQGGFDGAAHQATAFTEYRHRLLAELGAGLQQFFFRDAAVAP